MQNVRVKEQCARPKSGKRKDFVCSLFSVCVIAAGASVKDFPFIIISQEANSLGGEPSS